MNDDEPRRIPDTAALWPEATTISLMRSHRDLGDNHEDPMASMGNLFDVAILIGVGFMIVALSGFGLKELISNKDVTIVKNPGTAQMEIITKENGQIKTLKQTPQQAQGTGRAVGTVFELSDGRMVWVPGGTGATQSTATPAP
jgi:hypothetical protein